MCELCEKYGDGDLWFLNPENYGRPLYKKVEEGEDQSSMVANELRQAHDVLKPMIDKKEEDPESYQETRDQFEEIAKKTLINQVVTLKNAKKMAEIAQPIAKMDCICRRQVRGTLEDGEDRPRSCLGLGVGMFRWEEWPERYKGGVEFISTEEAKDHLEHWHKRGMVPILMTFGTPYIGGLCLCDYPDCLAIRMRLDYDMEALRKGHKVAKVDYDECTGCGTCTTKCQFKAINIEPTTNQAFIDMSQCFGCGACAFSCPQEAIEMVDRESVPELKDAW